MTRVCVDEKRVLFFLSHPDGEYLQTHYIKVLEALFYERIM